jgi:Spy/CpxP family protein refolding chaperone
MKTRITSLLLIAIFAISATTFAQNTQEKKRSSEQREMMMKRDKQMKHSHDSFFTEEQRETMKTLRLEAAKQVKPLKNELNELNAKQQTLVTADETDFNAINKNIDKMADLKADIQKIMVKQHQAIRSMLSEEQKLKFDAMKMKKGSRDGKFDRKRMERGERTEYGRRG